MKQGLGDHQGAVAELNRGLAAADGEAQRIELRFLRGGWAGAHGQARNRALPLNTLWRSRQREEAEQRAAPAPHNAHGRQRAARGLSRENPGCRACLQARATTPLGSTTRLWRTIS